MFDKLSLCVCVEEEFKNPQFMGERKSIGLSLSLCVCVCALGENPEHVVVRKLGGPTTMAATYISLHVESAFACRRRNALAHAKRRPL